ncbi:thioredoxin family protein [Sneathia vaginalis]|jgi:FAD-dependent pyridine nucleotide-disulphide oxidoreductase|uniref:thioredoxin family protein n=1 Tax=Sneathia vaginalis TaxID=187101 RepID=UPI002889D2BA|nr:thioredoxin family protein [Sneathia vaginalis]
MLLDENIKGQLKEYFKNITRPIVFHTKNTNDKMNEFLNEIITLNENLKIEKDDNLDCRDNSFEIFDGNTATGIVFSGIPGGHEFNSFILAILSIFGLGEKLTQIQINLVKDIHDKINIDVFISLSCTFCPDVVQSLNRIALVNKNIRVNTIDGNEYIDEVREKRVMASPSLYINNKFVTSGAQSTDKLINIIRGRHD